MFSGLPNLAVSFGYINASWTLRSDLIAEYVGRLINHMKARGFAIATPTPGPGVEPERLAMELSSGYVQRGADALPRSGNRAPWMVTANYKLDRAELRDGALDAPVLSALQRLKVQPPKGLARMRGQGFASTEYRQQPRWLAAVAALRAAPILAASSSGVSRPSSMLMPTAPAPTIRAMFSPTVAGSSA